MRRELEILNHNEAVRFFNQLLLDLRKREMGLNYEPFTEERLTEGGKHIRDLMECRRPAVIRY